MNVNEIKKVMLKDFKTTLYTNYFNTFLFSIFSKTDIC